MVHIGWLQDTHTHTDPNVTNPGAQQALVDDYDYLLNNIGVETIYHGGDVVHTDPPDSSVPHAEPSAYERFFDLVGQTSDPSALERLVPGNHDVPLSTFLAADERCVLRDRIDYPADNLTVLFLNTQATSFVTGSGGAGSQGGVGTEVTRVAQDDVGWLDQQISDADAQGNAVMVFPHGALTFFPSSTYPRVNGYRQQLDARSLYNVITNHRQVHGVLADRASAGANVVVPTSHLYQFKDENSNTIDGVNYVWKKHYWDGSDNTFSTFAHIQMDGTGATVTTVEHSDRTSTTVLDVTF